MFLLLFLLLTWFLSKMGNHLISSRKLQIHKTHLKLIMFLIVFAHFVVTVHDCLVSADILTD